MSTIKKTLILKGFREYRYLTSVFNRPDFQKMISDIKNKVINCVVVKNLKRFGREYVEGGYIVEKMFDDYNVRFIAIEDNVDTLKNDSDIMLPIKNVINSLYPKEVSKETRNALDEKTLNGEHLASKAPYGYVKSKTEKNKLEIDPVASQIVIEIFNLASQGLGFHSISKHLLKNDILNPQSYLLSNNPNYFKTKVYELTCKWHITSVRQVLYNEVYLGNVIHGRCRTKKVSSKQTVKRPKSEWLVKGGAHEPIISEELWQAAHDSLGSRKKVNSTGKTHLFAGLVCCSDCKTALNFNNRDFKKGELNGEFTCGKYKKEGSRACTTHYITFEKLYNIVYGKVAELAEQLKSNEKEFALSLQKAHDEYMGNNTDNAEKKIADSESRLLKLDSIINTLYEDKVEGIITAEQFVKMKSKYDTEYKTLQATLAELREKSKKQNTAKANLSVFTEVVRHTFDMEKLTAPMLNQLISKITVGHKSTNPETGEKEQTIDIRFKVGYVVTHSVLQTKNKMNAA